MKACFTILALASSALASNLARGGGGDDKGGDKYTTVKTAYETTTVCPVTYTTTKGGS